MKLSQFRLLLSQVSEINFILPDGSQVPSHFHITEVGLTTKHFVDCGGTIRTEKYVNFQVWTANDFAHRLAPQKLLKIIQISEPLLGDDDLEIEVEFQQESISRFGLDFDGANFHFSPKQTNCLAQDQCGIPVEKKRIRLSELSSISNTSCNPESGCC